MSVQKIFVPSHIKICIWKKNNQQILVIYNLLGIFYIPLKTSTNLKLSLQKQYLNLNSDKKASLFSYKALIRNILIFFARGLKAQLQLRGMGFRSQIKKNKLILKIGYSHLIYYKIPKGVRLKRIKKQKINVYGITNQILYQATEHLRNYRFPDIYKAKGLVYKGEKFKLKQGKKKSK